MDHSIFQAIGDTLTQITGIMISPLPMVALIAVMASEKGRLKAVVFGTGFFAGLWSATFLFAWIGGKVSDMMGGSGHSVMRTEVVYAALGLLLVVLSVTTFMKWLRKPSATGEPGWMKTIDSASMPVVFGIAIALLLGNPKNLPLIVSLATDYAHTGMGTARLAVLVTVSTLLGSLLTFLPIALVWITPRRAAKSLAEIRSWLLAYSGLILSVTLAIMGMHLLGKTLSGLFGG